MDKIDYLWMLIWVFLGGAIFNKIPKKHGRFCDFLFTLQVASTFSFAVSSGCISLSKSYKKGLAWLYHARPFKLYSFTVG